MRALVADADVQFNGERIKLKSCGNEFYDAVRIINTNETKTTHNREAYAANCHGKEAKKQRSLSPMAHM